MGPAFDQLQKEAARHGIILPDEFQEKMRKWCTKRGLLPAESDNPIESVPATASAQSPPSN